MDDIEAIKLLKARYFRTLDTRDWDALRQVFTDDFEIDMTEAGGGALAGADAFVGFLREILADAKTVHLGHTPEIQLTSEATASGVWALHDLFVLSDGTTLASYGHIYDAYARGPDGWRIASTRLTRLHSQVTQSAVS